MSPSIRFFLVISLCLTLLPVSPARAQSGGPFTPGPCMFTLPIGYTQDEFLQCGYLTVPADHAAASGATIRLAVVILKSQEAAPQPDPLFIAQGGPGASTIETYASTLLSDRPYPERDLVLFDQRGTLYSQPVLYCTEIDALTIQTLDQNLSPEESERLNLTAMTACRKRLSDQGINLSNFNSLQNAEDIESLRQALGYGKINLYGVSYGTLLALHFMRLHPESLRSVVLDGVVPPQTNVFLYAGQTENAAFNRLFAACQADAACNAEFPDLERVFFDLTARLNQEPVRITIQDIEHDKTYPNTVINGDTFQWLTFQLLYAGDVLPALPRMIYDARKGDFDVAGRILGLLLFDQSMSYGMYYSVECAEDADFTPGEQDLSGVRPEIARMEQRNPQAMLDICQAWNVQALGPQADQTVVSDVPTLLLSGAFDPVTPAPYAEQVAANLKNRYSFVFPAGGHGQFMSNDCADGLIGAFLNHPAQAPDAACIQNYPAPRFFTSRSVIDLPGVLKLLNLDGAAALQFLLLSSGWLFLMTAFLVFPLAWLVNRARRKRAAHTLAAAYPSPSPAIENPGDDLPSAWSRLDPDPLPDTPPPSPVFVRLSSWLAALEAALLGLFLVALAVVVWQMFAANDNRLFYGVPGEARPWFVLPLLFGVFSLDMLVTMVILWVRGDGSFLRRLYYSLLTLTALGCTLVMGAMGILSGLF